MTKALQQLIKAGESSNVQFKKRIIDKYDSLNIKAPVRIFIFDNRVEIHSLDALPNGRTIDDVKSGTSLPRKMFLFSNAIYLLPYTGVGSGITRALSEAVNVTFTNNTSAQVLTLTLNLDLNRREAAPLFDFDSRLRLAGRKGLRPLPISVNP